MPINFGSTPKAKTEGDSHDFLQKLGLIKPPVLPDNQGTNNYFQMDNSPDTGFLSDSAKLATNVGKGLANIGVGAYNTVMHPIDTAVAVGEGALNTGKNIVQGAEKLSGAGMNLADKAVFGGLNAVTGQNVKPTDIPGVFTGGTPANQSVGADITQGVSGALGASQGLFPVASTLFNAGANTEVGKQALAPLTGLSQTATDLAKKIPIVSDFYKGLAPERQQDFDSILNSAVQFGAMKSLSGTKPVENIQRKTGETITGIPKKTVDFVRPTRTTEEVSANILQPNKTMSSDLADAKNGLRTITKGMKEDGANFESLSKRADEIIKKQSDSIRADLSNADRFGDRVQNKYITNALGELSDTLRNEGSSKYAGIRNEIESLAKKHDTQGLNASEVNRVKELYTQNENLFNAKGQETGGFSAESQRATRQDLRSIVEDMAKKAGVPDIGIKNKVLGEVLNTKTMLENQKANRTAFLGRKANESPLQKVVGSIMELPGIKQVITAPLGTVASHIFKNLKAGKVDVLEVEKQLPKLIAELKRAGAKEGEVTRVENTLTEAIKASKTKNPYLLSGPSGKPQSAGIVNVKTSTGTPKEGGIVRQQGKRPVTPKKVETQKLLPAPRIPAGTSIPRKDIVAESMQGVKSKRPGTSKGVPKKQ